MLTEGPSRKDMNVAERERTKRARPVKSETASGREAFWKSGGEVRKEVARNGYADPTSFPKFGRVRPQQIIR